VALLNGKLNDVSATFTLQVKGFKCVTQQTLHGMLHYINET